MATKYNNYKNNRHQNNKHSKQPISRKKPSQSYRPDVFYGLIPRSADEKCKVQAQNNAKSILSCLIQRKNIKQNVKSIELLAKNDLMFNVAVSLQSQFIKLAQIIEECLINPKHDGPNVLIKENIVTKDENGCKRSYVKVKNPDLSYLPAAILYMKVYVFKEPISNNLERLDHIYRFKLEGGGSAREYRCSSSLCLNSVANKQKHSIDDVTEIRNSFKEWFDIFNEFIDSAIRSIGGQDLNELRSLKLDKKWIKNNGEKSTNPKLNNDLEQESSNWKRTLKTVDDAYIQIKHLKHQRDVFLAETLDHYWEIVKRDRSDKHIEIENIMESIGFQTNMINHIIGFLISRQKQCVAVKIGKEYLCEEIDRNIKIKKYTEMSRERVRRGKSVWISSHGETHYNPGFLDHYIEKKNKQIEALKDKLNKLNNIRS